MKQIEVGISIGAKGLEFTGINEVNSLLSKGGKVVSIEPGEALVDEVDSGAELDQFVLSGCTIKINIQV